MQQKLGDGEAKAPSLPNPTALIHNFGENTYFSISRKLIMNEDLNAANLLFGGRLMAWIDEGAALFCMGQMGTRNVVTKKFSEVVFNEPAHLGDIVEVLCRTKQVGRTSLTVECLVMTKVIEPRDKRRLIVNCDVVFVSLGKDGRPEPHYYSEERVATQDFKF